MIFYASINVYNFLKFWQTSPYLATLSPPLFWFFDSPAGDRRLVKPGVASWRAVANSTTHATLKQVQRSWAHQIAAWQLSTRYVTMFGTIFLSYYLMTSSFHSDMCTSWSWADLQTCSYDYLVSHQQWTPAIFLSLFNCEALRFQRFYTPMNDCPDPILLNGLLHHALFGTPLGLPRWS